ncbi:MAG: hypothetical protein ACTSWN_03025 [Promethearchaeota archaeon]
MSYADTLFKDRSVFVIREICPVTKKEIVFKITKDDYLEAERSGFPATWESEAYGSPMYRLQIVTNSSLQVLDKQAIPVIDQTKDKSISRDYTSKVLMDLGLSEKDVMSYFMMSGRGPIDLGEIMLLTDSSRDEAKKIAERLVSMGLARKIVGASDYWEALPPYAALVHQQKSFAEDIDRLKETTTISLDERFKQFEESTVGIKRLRDFQEFILKTSSEFAKKMDEFEKRKGEITETSRRGIQELRDFQNFIKTLGAELSKQIEEQDQALRKNTEYFEQLKNQNNENLEGIKDIINDIRTKRDNVEAELRERFQKLSGTAQAQLASQFQDLVNQFQELNQTLNRVNDRVANALDKMRLGPTTKRIQQVVKMTLAGSFSEIQNSVVSIQQSFINSFHQNFNQIIRVNLANFSNTIQSLLIDVVKQVDKIQQTNNNIVNSVKTTIDAVSNNIRAAFQQTSNNFENTIKDAEQKMGSVSAQLEKLLEQIVSEFEKIFSAVIKDFAESAKESKAQAEALSGEIDVALNTIRDVFKSEVVREIEKILANMEKRVQESQATISDFWERAKGEILYSLKEVWFVRSPEAVISSINEALTEAKMRVLIVAPTLDDIDIRPLLETPKKVNIRIACAIDITNDRHQAILSILDEHPNVSYRHYKGEVMIWGVNRDFEKCVVAVVSKEKEVAGIGTVLEEDIRLLTPILEDCWRSGKKDIFEGAIEARKKIDTTKMDLTFKPRIRTYYSTPLAKARGPKKPRAIRASTEIVDRTAKSVAETTRSPVIKTVEIPLDTNAPEMQTTAASMESVSAAGVSPIFTKPPADVNTLIVEGVKELEKLARIQTGNSLGDNIEAFRQALFNKIGFKKTLFDLARAVRELKKIPGPLNATQQQQYIERFRMWATQLKG